METRVLERERAAGLVAFAAPVLLVCAFSADAYHRFWAPKTVALLVIGAPGLCVLAALVARGDRVAAAATLFLAAAALSAAAADRPLLSFIGRDDWGSGWLFWALCVGVWAIARTTAEATRRAVGFGLVTAAAINVVVAVLQAHGRFLPDALQMSRDDPRPFGLLGNAVHLGGVCAAAAAIATVHARREAGQRKAGLWAAAVAVCSLGVQVSGGRVALAALALGIGCGLMKAPRARIALIVGAGTVGLLLGGVATAGTGYRGAATRVANEETAGSHARVVAWKAAGQAILDRPAFGFGPGRVAAAVTPRLHEPTGEPSDRLFTDAHSWPIQLLLETGLVGALGFGALIALSVVGGTGVWLGAVAAIGASTLLQPLSPATVPIAMFGLGTFLPPATLRAGRVLRISACAAAAVAGVIGGWLIAADVGLRAGSDDFSQASIDRAHDRLPPWPDVSLAALNVHAFYGVRDPAARSSALSLAKEAVRRDPADPHGWVRLGDLEAIWGSKDAAERAYRRALVDNPWSEAALTGTARLAEERGDHATVETSCRRAARAQPTGQCAGRPLSAWRSG